MIFIYRLINIRKDTFSPSYRLIAEFLPVMPVNGIGTGNEVGKSPPYENPGSRREREYGKTSPFYQLAEVVGGSDVAVKPFGGR